MMKIAVTMDFYPGLSFVMKSDLVDCLQNHGFEIVPLLYNDKNISEKLNSVSGVLIPGGDGDVDPALFGQKKKYDCVKINRSRCDFEFQLLNETFKRDLPFLGICWGLQVLNVYLGGTLIQDICLENKNALVHQKNEKEQNPMHEVVLKKEAASLIGKEKLIVNSTHHQSIDQLAETLENQGSSSDGIIECVRMKNKRFAWAVQWHPERLADDLFIRAFREACQRSN